QTKENAVISVSSVISVIQEASDYRLPTTDYRPRLVPPNPYTYNGTVTLKQGHILPAHERKT
ncbi:MAG: hypothetical protein ABIQ44_00780, partial [Chloroflexia bacterium]